MKKLSLIGLFSSLLLLSGCITIFEKYTIHSDGTGTMEYLIDMSELYDMMASFSDSTEEIDNSSIDQSMREAIPGLENIEGIDNISLTGDISRYIAGIKFDFKDANALNKAITLLFEGDENVVGDEKYVEIKGKTFTRFGKTSEEFSEDLLGDEELDEETMKSVIEGMKYKISVSFDKKIKSIKTHATYTQEDNSIVLEANFSEMQNNPEILNTIIKTK